MPFQDDNAILGVLCRRSCKKKIAFGVTALPSFGVWEELVFVKVMKNNSNFTLCQLNVRGEPRGKRRPGGCRKESGRRVGSCARGSPASRRGRPLPLTSTGTWPQSCGQRGLQETLFVLKLLCIPSRNSLNIFETQIPHWLNGDNDSCPEARSTEVTLEKICARDCVP